MLINVTLSVGIVAFNVVTTYYPSGSYIEGAALRHAIVDGNPPSLVLDGHVLAKSGVHVQHNC